MVLVECQSHSVPQVTHHTMLVTVTQGRQQLTKPSLLVLTQTLEHTVDLRETNKQTTQGYQYEEMSS